METNYLNLSTSLLFFILALILFIRHSPTKGPNNFLGVLFLLIAAYYELIHLHFQSVNSNNFTQLTNYLPLETFVLMLMSPCLYFYVLMLLNRPVKINRWSSLLHVIPLLPCVLFNVLFYFRPVDERVDWLIRNFYSGSMEMILINVVLYLQIIIYLFIDYRAIKKQLKISVYVEKNGFRTNITWVEQFLRINIIVALITLPFCFLINNERTSLLIGQLAMNFEFIFLFILTTLKAGMLETEKVEVKKIPRQINEEQAVHNWKMLTAFMDSSKLYRDGACSLSTLAEPTKISGNEMSRLLHEYGKTSSSKFINKYRLEEAIASLQDKSKYRKTIDTIAFNCGFGSRSSFYRVFKRVYGISPAKYRKQFRIKPEA
ncbi:MAG: helix-turn-helix domain-containing protein [Paludibacter sp.]